MNKEAIVDMGAATALHFAEATNLSLIFISSGDVEYANPSACALFGYSKEELIGQLITIIIPERMRGAHMAGLARVAAVRNRTSAEKRSKSTQLERDGTEFPIEITLSIWQGDSGLCAGAVIKDISERRERESRLMRLASQNTLTGPRRRASRPGQDGECDPVRPRRFQRS